MVLAEWTGQTLFHEKIENLCEKKFCLLPKFLMLLFFFFFATSLAVKALSPNHWSPKEFPKCS